MPSLTSKPPIMIRRVCVFLGSSLGQKLAYVRAATALGHELAQQKLGLVYGGGNVGLMGALARAGLDAGGEVIGIIPKALLGREVSGTRIQDPGVSRLEIVDSMHTRKARMAELSDAFIALPGGYGTLEELLEILTWAQLGFHQKPIGLLNVEGFFDPLLTLFDQIQAEGFIREDSRRLIIADHDPKRLIGQLQTATIPPSEHWITSKETL